MEKYLEVKDYELINIYMNTVNDIARDIFLGFSAILAVVALVNISNTIIINVVMRKRELGVLRVVGLSKTEILWLILKEGGVNGLISSNYRKRNSYFLLFLL